MLHDRPPGGVCRAGCPDWSTSVSMGRPELETTPCETTVGAPAPARKGTTFAYVTLCYPPYRVVSVRL